MGETTRILDELDEADRTIGKLRLELQAARDEAERLRAHAEMSERETEKRNAATERAVARADAQRDAGDALLAAARAHVESPPSQATRDNLSLACVRYAKTR